MVGLFKRKLSEGEKQAAREAATESAYTGKASKRTVGNTEVYGGVNDDPSTVNVYRGDSAFTSHTNVKPKRFWG